MTERGKDILAGSFLVGLMVVILLTGLLVLSLNVHF